MAKTTSEQLLEEIAESPKAREALDEVRRDRERALDAQRARAAAATAAITKKAVQETPALRARVEKTRQAAVGAEEALKVALGESKQAYSAMLTLSNMTTGALDEQQQIMQATVPQEAVDFIRLTWDLFDEARTTGRVEANWRVGSRQLFQRVEHRALSNVPSLAAYIAALKAAREEVLRLCATEPSRAKIRERIRQLHETLPTVKAEEVEN
jgi:hypothetical protein